MPSTGYLNAHDQELIKANKSETLAKNKDKGYIVKGINIYTLVFFIQLKCKNVRLDGLMFCFGLLHLLLFEKVLCFFIPIGISFKFGGKSIFQVTQIFLQILESIF